MIKKTLSARSSQLLGVNQHLRVTSNCRPTNIFLHFYKSLIWAFRAHDNKGTFLGAPFFDDFWMFSCKHLLVQIHNNFHFQFFGWDSTSEKHQESFSIFCPINFVSLSFGLKNVQEVGCNVSIFVLNEIKYYPKKFNLVKYFDSITLKN